MNIMNKIALASVIVGAGFLAGCNSSSSSSSTPKYTPYTRVGALAAQTATVTIADPTGTPVVTISPQPANITLAATATIPAANALDVKFTATNASGRSIFNPKIIMDNAGATLNGATVSGSTGSIGGDDYVFLGPTALANGASLDAADNLSFNTTGSTGSITFNVSIPTEDISLYFINSGGSGASTVYNFDTGNTIGANSDITNLSDIGYRPGSSTILQMRDGVSSPDGAYIYMGSKHMPTIVELDTATNKLKHVTYLLDKGQIGATDSVTMSPNGQFLYASVLKGDHLYQYYSHAESRPFLVKVDRATMQVVASLELSQDGGSSQRPRRLSISADGTTGVVPLDFAGAVAIVDLTDMTLTKVVDLSATSVRPRYAAISPDGSTAYVAYTDDQSNDQFETDGEISVINLSDYSVTSLMPTTPGAGSNNTYQTRDLRFGPDGRLYYERNSTANQLLTIYDVSTTPATETEISTAVTGSSTTRTPLAFGPYGKYYYMCNGSSIVKINMADDTQVSSTPTGASNCYHMLIPSAY